MKRLLIAAALALAACEPPQVATTEDPATQTSENDAPSTHASTDAAGNVLEAMTARGEQQCSADGAWCIDATGIITGGDGVQRAITTSIRDTEDQTPWPWIIRLADGNRALVGQTYRNSDMYSGGGAWETWLTLYEVSAGSDEAKPVVSVMLNGTASIRACFDEDDMRERFEACADEYSFGGAINLDDANAGGAPRLIYTTRASTYPGRRSRTTDSADTPPASQADLVWAVDETCTYRRVFTAGAEGYTPDQPVPECSDYRTQ